MMALKPENSKLWRKKEIPPSRPPICRTWLKRIGMGIQGNNRSVRKKIDFVTTHTLGNEDSEPTKSPSPNITNTSLDGKQNEPIPPISFNNAFSTNTPFSLSHQPVPHSGKQNEPIPRESFTNTSATKTLESLKD
ncbi:hypothetical protein RJT34_19030 [Clitoria ternatea]|uniref:Uncharacterized protein n=1 Tax=Clitoria ternatea TaxID=43366 RepID=A0AAN9P3S8_CLITE